MRRRECPAKSHKTPSLKSLEARAAKIDAVLTDVYGRKKIDREEDPLDTLVETILSQNTTDKNSHRAFRILKSEYPNWEDMDGADLRHIANLIRPGGLADIKADRILGALEFIKKNRGELRLDFLRRMKPHQADAWLAQMKGVGPKTRGIILLFALRMPAFPVDTHIHRVTRRLGLIGRKTSREGAQTELSEIVPPSEYYNFHINLIEHGRAVCQARKPRCGACKIRKYCDYFAEAPSART